MPINLHRSLSDSQSWKLDGEKLTVTRTEAFEQPQIQQLTPEHPALPVVNIVEQPAQYYRFRYQSEVQGDRIGGLLPGRRSDSRSYMKLQVSGIEPSVHTQLRLVACTVSSDRGPHPYYLIGDNCRDGYFEVKMSSVDACRSAGVWEIKFDRLSIICVPKKSRRDIERALEDRAAKVPQLCDSESHQAHVYSKCQRTQQQANAGSSAISLSAPLDARSLSKIRLAFSLSFTDPAGIEWTLPTVYSEEILDEKDKKRTELSIECLNPAEVPQGCSTEVAIYTSTPTNVIDRSDLKVLFTFVPDNASNEDAKTTVEVDVLDMKKHLIIVKTPVMRANSQQHLLCHVTIRCQQFCSRERLTLIFQPDATRPYQCRMLGTFGRSLKRSSLD